MSLVRMLRALWMPGLPTITGHVKAGLRDWIEDRNYQITQRMQPTSFVLDVAASQPLLNSFAADINRMSAAAFESALGVEKNPLFPRASGWLVIETYYAAFFAAHALLRMFGTSITQFDSSQASSIDSVAKMYGMAGTKRTAQGAYICIFDSPKSKLTCELAAQTGGVHQVFWGIFAGAVNKWSDEVLTINTETSTNKQAVSERLVKVVDNLRFGPYTNASWLSQVRNAVNYRHEMGCWYPFRYEKPSYGRLHEHVRVWLDDPMMIDLTISDERDLRGFQNTCHFIVGVCRELTQELVVRSTGKSFTTYRPIVVLNLAGRGTGHAST